MSEGQGQEPEDQDNGSDSLPVTAPTVVATATQDESKPAPKSRPRWLKALLIILLALVLLGAGLVAGGGYLLQRLEGNVTTLTDVGTAPAVESYEPVNFLIMGSDTRDNGNSVEDEGIDGQRSDTVILVHLNADRDRALGVSIPRDTLLPLPACASESGRWEVKDKFNVAFAFGGPACTVETVERLTGLPIHHAVVVDFLGFKHMVEALGGVQVCLEEPVRDPDSGLDLPAGWSTVQGDQALAFVRARKNLGDGSDISRIDRQHAFISSAIRQATDRELLKNPVKLYKVLDAATSSLSVDGNLDGLSEMADTAQSLRNLRPENISFVTMPVVYADDGSSVLVKEDAAAAIWAAIKADQPWPPTAETIGPEPLTVQPEDIRVRVLNGNGLDNAATNASNDLRAIGFRISGLDLADRADYPESVIRYNPVDIESARTLKAAVPTALLQQDPEASQGQLTLIVGASYTPAVPVVVPRVPAGTIDDPKPVTADTSICSS